MEALGMVETKGLTAAIEAADAMVKAANVVSSRLISPFRTPATTSALRRITHRFVSGGGRSSMVNGCPAGPITAWPLLGLSNTIDISPLAAVVKSCAATPSRLPAWP